VARQTVYAHYPSREALLAAVADRAMSETLAAIDAAEPQRGSPVEALDRLISAWWESVGRHARVLEALAEAFPDRGETHAFHAPVLDRLERLVRRGQRSGDFDRRLPDAWAAAALLGLLHVAAEELAAGRVEAAEAERALRLSIPRVFGVGGGDPPG
jgi:AcrR family transcriptional regulator